MTATPFFLSKLQNEPGLRATFTSYLSVTYMIANFIALTYCTLTSNRADNTARIRASSVVFAVSFCLLAISPALPLSETAFFRFVILNGIIQSCAGSFLATAVIAVAALFGPGTLAVLFTGQGLVGAFIAVVQYISAASSFHADTLAPGPSSRFAPRDSLSESTNVSLYAFAFFGFAAFFTAITVGAHTSLVRTPLYRAVVLSPRTIKTVTPFEPDEEANEDGGLENQPFLSLSIHEDRTPGSDMTSVVELCTINVPFNFAVAWIYVVTLVRGTSFGSPLRS